MRTPRFAWFVRMEISAITKAKQYYGYNMVEDLEGEKMEEEWYDDRCCATCKKGELVQDNDEGEMVYCKPIDE